MNPHIFSFQYIRIFSICNIFLCFRIYILIFFRYATYKEVCKINICDIATERSIVCLSQRTEFIIRGNNGSCKIYSAPFAVNHYSTQNALYSEADVREYWIVDPAWERATVYHCEEDIAPVIFSFDQSITVGIYGDLQINIAELLK